MVNHYMQLDSDEISGLKESMINLSGHLNRNLIMENS